MIALLLSLVLAGVDPQASARDLAEEYGLKLEDVSRVARNFRVITLPEDVYIFHRNKDKYFSDVGVDVPDSMGDWHAYFDRRMQEFYRGYPSGKGMRGPGLYFHQGLSGASGYGPNILVVKIPAGSRVLLGDKMARGYCGKESFSGLLKSSGQCRALAHAVMKALRIDALAYKYGHDLTHPHCSKNISTAFVVTDHQRARPVLGYRLYGRSHRDEAPPGLDALMKDNRKHFHSLNGLRRSLLSQESLDFQATHLFGCDENLPVARVSEHDLDWDYPRQNPSCQMAAGPQTPATGISEMAHFLERRDVKSRGAKPPPAPPVRRRSSVSKIWNYGIPGSQSWKTKDWAAYYNRRKKKRSKSSSRRSRSSASWGSPNKYWGKTPKKSPSYKRRWLD